MPRRAARGIVRICSKKGYFRFTDLQKHLDPGNEDFLRSHLFNIFGVVYAVDASYCTDELQFRDLCDQTIERAASIGSIPGLSGRPICICLIGALGENDEQKKCFRQILRKRCQGFPLRHIVYFHYLCRPLGVEVEQYVAEACEDQIIQRRLRAGFL